VVLGGQLKSTRTVRCFQHHNVLVQPFEHLVQALAHQIMVIDDENFQDFCPASFLQSPLIRAALAHAPRIGTR
jgi:hypothetical protein